MVFERKRKCYVTTEESIMFIVCIPNSLPQMSDMSNSRLSEKKHSQSGDKKVIICFYTYSSILFFNFS